MYLYLYTDTVRGERVLEKNALKWILYMVKITL